MHIQMSGYLLLGVAVFLHGINDLLISFSSCPYNIFRKYFIERRPVHIPMTLGYLRDVLMFLDMGDQAIHKIVFTQDGLPLYLSPDSLLAYPPFDKLPVFLLGLGPFSTELSKNPIRGQARWQATPVPL